MIIPKTAADVCALLTFLRKRRDVLDDLIRSLERYSVYEFPVTKRQAPNGREKNDALNS